MFRLLALLSCLYVIVCLPARAEEANVSRAFEFRYVSSASNANGETDFKGETAVFTTEERVAFLRQYADYAAEWFGVPKLDQEVVKDDEATAALAKIKPQPLPAVRKRIPLSEWRWLGYRPGENAEHRAALDGWSRMEGVTVQGGVLRFEKNARVRRELEPQSWRMAIQWDVRAPRGVGAAFRLCDGDDTVTTVGLDARGRVYHSSEGKRYDGPAWQPDRWHSFKLEIDFTADRYNFYVDGALAADFVPLENPAARLDSLVIEAGAGVSLDNLWGVGFAPNKHPRELYTIKTFIDEDFQLKPEPAGWQEPSYDDSGWETTRLPHAHGGERNATQDLYLRCTVAVKDFQRAILEAETLDPGGEIWVNGRVVAVISNLHPVRVDVTSFLEKNRENHLAVKVNSCRRGGWVVDPYVGWFAGRMHLDLVRNTHIREVLAHAVDVGDPARVKFRIDVENEQRPAFSGRLVVRFYPWHPEECAEPVATHESPLSLYPYSRETVEREVEVLRPRLWSFQHPNLYRVQVLLVDANGTEVDDYVFTTGIRTVSQEGGTFRINGKPEMLNGPLILGLRPPLDKIAAWSRCAPAHLLLKDLMVIQRMNGNAVRMAIASPGLSRNTWPDVNDPRLAEMGDQLGMMFIWETTAGIWWGDAWGVDWEGYQKYIRQVYNHPSIVMWEVNNEATTKAWNDWYQKVYETISPVDPSRLISGYTHLAFQKDKPERDADGNPMKPGWTAPMVTRGNHDAVTGYGAQWSKLRTWDRSEFLNSAERAFFNFEQEESIGQPNWDLVKGKPWHGLHSYEWGYDESSIGRNLEIAEWRESQGWQAFSLYESMKKQRMLDYDGFNWCCLDGGLFTVNYHKPLLDYFYRAKLSFYANGMVFQRLLSGSNNVDVVYGPQDQITPMILNLGEEKTVDLKVEVKTNKGRRVDEKTYRNVRLAGGRTVTTLASWRPKFPGDGYYAIEYTTTVREEKAAPSSSGIHLWKRIELGENKGMYPTLGDLNNDGRVDFVLHAMGPHTTPARLVALNHDGKLLWQAGVKSATGHERHGRETPCRGLCLVYDIDQDGRSEVVSELWQNGTPMLVAFDGATGRLKHSVPSPFDMSVRAPEGFRSSRSVPKAFVAFPDGKSRPPRLMLKYDASNTIPPHAVMMDASLGTLWHVRPKLTAIGHISSVADVNGDGRDEFVLGELVLDGNGQTVFENDFGRHADMVTVADVIAGGRPEILVSVCSTGPAYCLSAQGDVLWQKSKEEVSHGQAIWAGDFIVDEPGNEVVILCSGHVGDFITCRGSDGATLARFQHRSTYRAYPDMPARVRWLADGSDLLWIPVDRALVDGRGKVAQTLGPYDREVDDRLRGGSAKSQLPVQAFAADLCGDEREELVLYQPYAGEAIYIFTQDAGAREKPYQHSPELYNMRTYF